MAKRHRGGLGASTEKHEQLAAESSREAAALLRGAKKTRQCSKRMHMAVSAIASASAARTHVSLSVIPFATGDKHENNRLYALAGEQMSQAYRIVVGCTRK